MTASALCKRGVMEGSCFSLLISMIAFELDLESVREGCDHGLDRDVMGSGEEDSSYLRLVNFTEEANLERKVSQEGYPTVVSLFAGGSWKITSHARPREPRLDIPD